MAAAALGSALLSWDDFQQERTVRTKQMLASQTFTDVTLLCGGPGAEEVAITAHRVILAAASEFFGRVLGREQDRGAVLFLRGAAKENVISLLNFIYSGECSVDMHNLDDFVALAKDLKIKSLENYSKVVRNVPRAGAGAKVPIQRVAAPPPHVTTYKQYRKIRPHQNLAVAAPPPDSAPAELGLADTADTAAAETSFETQYQVVSGQLQQSDQLAMECQSIIQRLATGTETNKDDLSEPSPAPSAVADPGVKTETLDKNMDTEQKTASTAARQVDTKDPIALFEQKIESLIVYNERSAQYTCKVCNFDSSKKSVTVEHVELHIDGFMFACNSCTETFPNRPRLRKHKFRCSGNK